MFVRLSGQPVPGKDENIPFLVTFGKDGKTSWGDADFYQIFFFRNRYIKFSFLFFYLDFRCFSD